LHRFTPVFGWIADIQSNGPLARRHLQDKLFLAERGSRYRLDEAVTNAHA
jgi:hypothetical protein